MPPEEQEITLVMQRNNLPPLKLWQRGEEILEHPTDGMAQTGDEIVQN